MIQVLEWAQNTRALGRKLLKHLAHNLAKLDLVLSDEFTQQSALADSSVEEAEFRELMGNTALAQW